MSKKHSRHLWYIFPCNSWTRKKVIFELNALSTLSATVRDIGCSHAEIRSTLDLIEMRSFDEVQFLRRKKADFKLNFKIFISNGPDEPICRWSHDEGV